MNSPSPRHDIVGVKINATSYEQVVEQCRQWILDARADRSDDAGRSAQHARPRPARTVCICSVHGIVHAFKRPIFRRLLNRADMATPDGMPIVWALRSFGVRGQQRVYGPTLMLHLCRAAAEGFRVFLYGAAPETVEQLGPRLEDRFPGLRIAGTYSPPFRRLTAGEERHITRTILASRADIVFVGISTPKQEAWMARFRDRLPGMVLLGVGAAFDFHAGRVPQAPPWMRRAGLEWFYRLLREPRRLWKRYLLETPLFLPLWALQKVGRLRRV